MVEFREITRDNLGAVCRLRVAPEQDDLVSPNVMTMAEVPFEPGAWVRALWLGEEPVGLLAMLRPSAYPEDEDIEIRRDAAYVWRLMVAEDFQGRGFGKAALDEARRMALSWGYKGMTLTVGQAPHSAIPFYQRYGFEKTGRVLWGDAGEIEMVCWFGD